MTKVESVSITTLFGLLFSNGCAPPVLRASLVEQWSFASTSDTKVSCFLTIAGSLAVMIWEGLVDAREIARRQDRGAGKGAGAKARAPFSFLRARVLGGLRPFFGATPSITVS
jgi:hypothetical protein